jgi:hypothetical protein
MKGLKAAAQATLLTNTDGAAKRAHAVLEDPRLQEFSLATLSNRSRFAEYERVHKRVLDDKVGELMEKFQTLQFCCPQGAFRALTELTTRPGAEFRAPGATKEEQMEAALAHFRAMGGDAGGVGEVAELGFVPLPHRPDFRTGTLSEDEIKTALFKVAAGKAAGEDQVPVEALRLPCVFPHLVAAFRVAYDTRTVPDGWKVIVQVPIPKKGDLTRLENWRPICLLNIIVKVYHRVLLNRLLAVDGHLRFNQSGFRKNRSVDEQQATLAHIISSVKRLKDENYSLIINFLDFAKAFPSTSWTAIRGAMQAMHVPEELTSAVMAIYSENLRAYVKCPGFSTSTFPIHVGTLQGDVLAPYLFVLVVDRVLATAMADLHTRYPQEQFGILLRHSTGTDRTGRVPAMRLTDLAFADDIALITLTQSLETSRLSAQKLLSAVAAVSARANLKMKAGEAKTAILIYGLGEALPPNDPAVQITLGPGGPLVPIVQKYKYLGRVFDHALGISNTVITQRIQGAYHAVSKLKPVWDCPSVLRPTKEKLFECFVRPSLIFSSASWILTKAQLSRIDRAFTRMRRIALKIPRLATAHGTVEIRSTPLHEIYSNGAGGCLNSASTSILQTKLRLFGHVLRHDVPMQYGLFWEPDETVYGTRKPGGRRRNLLDDYLLLLPENAKATLNLKFNQKTITSRAVDSRHVINYASDRDGWAEYISTASQVNQRTSLNLAID